MAALRARTAVLLMKTAELSVWVRADEDGVDVGA
jgi:hypothetical protein